jgi:Domain of unknown function (DUF3387)
VKAKLRSLVRRLLRKYKYPPDAQEKATETVLKQAEILAAQTSGGGPAMATHGGCRLETQNKFPRHSNCLFPVPQESSRGHRSDSEITGCG